LKDLVTRPASDLVLCGGPEPLRRVKEVVRRAVPAGTLSHPLIHAFGVDNAHSAANPKFASPWGKALGEFRIQKLH
jgi:hypothetical protein